MNSVEIFAGGGGLALGLKKAGFSHASLVERDRNSSQTLLCNHKIFGFSGGKLLVRNGDIRSVSFLDFTDKIDLLSGGPPCQPFSIGGKHKAHNDSRDMFPEATRALREIRPRAFIFENVRGLLRKNFSQYFGYIILQLTHPEIPKRPEQEWQDHLSELEKHHTGNGEKGLHYNVVYRLLNAADYGVPQKRERVFIVGFRNDVNGDWSFPDQTHGEAALNCDKFVSRDYWERHSVKPPLEIKASVNVLSSIDGKKPWVTVRDAIGDLPDPEHPNDFFNHKLQRGAKSYAGHTGSALDEPSKTIKAGDHGVPGGENMMILDSGALRYYTVREAARLRTFPDDYFFPCSWTENMRQIGNAVPVKLGAMIASSVKKALRSSAETGRLK